MDRLLREDAKSSATAAQKWSSDMERAFRYYVDKSVPHLALRWIGFAVLLLLFLVRIVAVQGFYIVAYGLGIYFINQIITFLTPQTDPDAAAPTLPLKDSDEFKPFIRKLPEFKFWYGNTKAALVALSMTSFRIFDLPAYWPILLIYWLLIFALHMRQRISHMMKHRYVPFSVGKKRYTGRKKTAY